MPEKDKNILLFQHHHKQMCSPYIIYANFKVLNILAKGAARYPCISNTRLVAKQIPYSDCYVVVHGDVDVKGPILYHGENAMKKFLGETSR